MTDKTKGFTLTRQLAASPDQIWDAWTNPQEIAAWWHPKGAHTPSDSVSVDLRVGGRYQYAMVNDEDGTTVVTGGVYLELERHSRLVFTWGEPDADPADAPVITLTLTPMGTGTLLTLDLRGVEGQPGDGFFYDGWVSTLESLSDYVTEP
ncbi:SRPBCC domain-containing protein [uncultured Tessaracoccus sp.]|uniref:SRPBCC family protein n=1 Tax=uncultured Tessaracoccus sp. TaxID=905023 RepID=UPI0026137B57|nr:SRPBCC domain-containing protein [uncultured Tessaracoccus sp.]